LRSRVLRDALVDRIRREAAAKRGGRCERRPLCEEDLVVPGESPAVLAVREAMDLLSHVEPLLATIATLHAAQGLSLREIATGQGDSIHRVREQWRRARAWLQHKVSVAQRDA
jgi:DNA-directed RNA polymerase specialized sigma24 family protein